MTTGTDWIDPVHDAAVNMTTIPKPADPANGYTATYDAWNRLMKLETLDGQQQTITVAEYEYDGQNQRIVKKTYIGGQIAETRHFYYNDRWQCLEERLEGIASGAPNGTSSANPTCRYVWGTRYVDK